jgi:hypothetical protein
MLAPHDHRPVFWKAMLELATLNALKPTLNAFSVWLLDSQYQDFYSDNMESGN